MPRSLAAAPGPAVPPNAAPPIPAQTLLPARRGESNLAVPYWVPAGVELVAWPDDLKRAVAEVINPAYHQLVVRAQPGMAQSLGVTIVHLLWLEIIDHINLARLGHGCEPPAADDPDGLMQLAAEATRGTGLSRDQIIERHLRVVHTKLKTCAFLPALREFKAQWPRVDSWTAPNGQKNIGDYLDGPAEPLPPR